MRPIINDDTPSKVSRRAVLKMAGAAGAGLLLGVQWYHPAEAAGSDPERDSGIFAPNAFVRIAPDNTVTIIAKHLEMGQGIHTGLATIVAEELDADWSQIRARAAPADASLYNNLFWGPYQGTGGSSGIANSFDQLRRAGATARAMLIAAAAQQWSVPLSEITVASGVVRHERSKRSSLFGALAEKAATFPVPANVTLKDPKKFTLIGRRLPRLDTSAKTDGGTRYAYDLRLPNMVTAVIARPPAFGARVKRYESDKTRSVPGVIDVIPLPEGIAVVAEGTWAALRGREALNIEWDLEGAERRGSTELMNDYRAQAKRPGAVARHDGDAEMGLNRAAKRIEAEFEFPYLAHAPMEPLSCVARIAGQSCEIWSGSQLQTVDQARAAAVAGLKPEQVSIHTLMAGGSFGRRATPDAGIVTETVRLAKALGGDRPVKVVWSREDDIKGGRYRPMYYHHMAGGLDAAGNIVAWRHRIVGQSILAGTPFAALMIKEGVDATSVEGAANLPYAIPHLRTELITTDVGIPVLWWRSVGSTHTAFATETFLDELAHAAGKDPLTLRRTLLKNHPRHRAVLDLAATKAGWGQKLPTGRARGIAVHESFHTVVAQVADVSIESGKIRVHRVVCAVDCGIAINPDVIVAQMEGGIGFGLGAALHSAITLKQGQVEQSNFDDFVTLRIDEMPKVEVHIVLSAAAPTGVGEPGVPPIAPAVANAVFALTGRRLRTLPFDRETLTRT